MSIGDWFKDKDTDLFAGSAVDVQIRKAQIDKHFAEAQPDGMNYWTPLQKLAMRMGWVSNLMSMHNNGIGNYPDAIKPFEFLSAYECTASAKVYLFGVIRGTPMTFEDDIYMFPSDRLIGQLKTLAP